MKKIMIFLLAAVLTLSLAACGSAAAPAPAVPTETASPVTEPAAVETTAQTEPEESVSPVLLTRVAGDDCMKMLCQLGYREVNPDLYGKEIQTSVGATGASATPASMEVYADGFRMELDTVEYFYEAKELRQTDGWVLYGTKGDGLGLVPDLESQGYELLGSDLLTDDNSLEIYDMADYTYVRWGEDGYAEAMAFVTAAYYPQTGNLYNVVQEFFGPPEEYGTAIIFATEMKDYVGVYEIESLQWDDFTVELHPFIVQCGKDQFLYQYRKGMSFSDWACSELNTAGWIPWYDDMVLSPDRKYIAGTGYLEMQKANYEEILTIYAEEFDGQLNHTYLYSFEIMDSVENKDDALAYLKSEETEIKSNGNINVAVAHMVNARTPLMTPGFRIVGREEGRAAYHSVEIGGSLYLLDDILDIYMNEIDDALIPHIKLYAFPESEEFMKTLEGKLILNAHSAPLEQDSEMLKIPEDAVCLTFERVPDGQEAPDSPNPRRPGHENLNHNAVYARYVTKDDPNFGEDVNLVFAVTFDEELVYWIHMGSNFHETVDVKWIVNAMGY